MSWEAQGFPVFRVELWHALLVGMVLLVLVPQRIVEPRGLLFGGLFMGANFLLLYFGIRWVIAPFASRGRVRAGVSLLLLKFLLLLGVSWLLLAKVSLDGLSFALGVSCLIVAILIDRLYAAVFE